MHGNVPSWLVLTVLAALSAGAASVAPPRINVPGSGLGEPPYEDAAAPTKNPTKNEDAMRGAGQGGTAIPPADTSPATEAAPADPADTKSNQKIKEAIKEMNEDAMRGAGQEGRAIPPADASPATEAAPADPADTESAPTAAPTKNPEELVAENAETMAHLKAQDQAVFEKCVQDAGFNVSSREESLVQDIVEHTGRFVDNANPNSTDDEASVLAYKIDQAKVIADCRATAIGSALGAKVNDLQAEIGADKAEETAITCKKDIQTYIEEQTKSLFEGEIERMELLKRAKTAVQLASKALVKNTARSEARVVLAKTTLLNVQRQTALLKATKLFLVSARASLDDPALIANENMMCQIKSKIKADVLDVKDFASDVEKGEATSAEALRVSNCIKKKTTLDEGGEKKGSLSSSPASDPASVSFLEKTVAPKEKTKAAVAVVAVADEKPCILANALATLPSRQGQPALPANAPPADPLADSVEDTESMETLVKTEILHLDETMANAMGNIKQAAHDHVLASSAADRAASTSAVSSAEEGKEVTPAAPTTADEEAKDAGSLLQVASAHHCLKERAHAAHILFETAKSKAVAKNNKMTMAPLLSLVEKSAALKEHLAATAPCADHVYDLLLEMEVQAGHRAATKTGAQAWALRARAAARAGQRMQWKSDMYEKNPKKIDCDTAYKCKEKIEEKKKKDAQPKTGGFLSGLVNAVAGGILGDTCVICPDQLFLPAIKAYKMDEFTEKGPLGRTDAMERVQYRFVDPEDWDGKSGKHTFGEPDEVGQPCLPAIDDEFVMPCCKPKVNPITDGLIIAGRPPFAMDDQVGQGAADDFLQVMEKKLRGGRSREKKAGGFVGALGAVAAGAGAAAGMSIPYIPGSPSIKWNSENTFLGMNCCGGGPACCRWCPEQLCESLEMSSEKLEPLWWAVCSETDVSGNPSTRR